MRVDPIQALQAARRPPSVAANYPLVVAGATGTLGNEVLRRLLGTQRFGVAHVLAREAFTDGLRNVNTVVLPGTDVAAWPPVPARRGWSCSTPRASFRPRARALDAAAPRTWWPSPAGCGRAACAPSRWCCTACARGGCRKRSSAAWRPGRTGCGGARVWRVIYVRSAQKRGWSPARWDATARGPLDAVNLPVHGAQQ